MANVNKITQGNAAQLLVASELNRRGWSAAVTLGNAPHVDVLCSNQEGTRFAFIQVKSFHVKKKSCTVGKKAENKYGNNFFWVIVGLKDDKKYNDEFYIVPASVMSEKVYASHIKWLNTPGKKGQQHKDTSLRQVHVGVHEFEYDITPWKDRWDLIEESLKKASKPNEENEK
jgi:hypothetical protein